MIPLKISRKGGGSRSLVDKGISWGKNEKAPMKKAPKEAAKQKATTRL
jgi:hypothetical protein